MIAKPRVGIKPNWGHRASKGLVGCWLFNEKPDALGKVHDLSGYGNHGTLILNAKSAPGKFGNAITLDGTNDYVDTGDMLSSAAAFTALAWVYPDKVNAEHGVWSRDGVDCSLWLDDNGGGSFGFEFYQNAGSPARLEDPVARQLQWYCVVITMDGLNKAMYIDGELIDTDSAGGTTLSAGPANFLIGKGHIADEWEGRIDHVMMWNRALSAGEVKSLYIEPFQMFEVDL